MSGGGGMRFAGYASVFDHADRSGDVVRRGAFARARPVSVSSSWMRT